MTEPELSKFLSRTFCPRKFARLEVRDMYPNSDREYRAALRRVEGIGERLSSRDFLRDPVFTLLTGVFGSGKTRAACWLLRAAFEGLGGVARGGNAETGEPATVVPTAMAPLFIRAAQLAELRFRSLSREDEAGEEEDRREALRDRLDSASLLVIDDVTRVAGYRGEEHFVESVIERRWEADRSVVLTGNLDGEADESGRPVAGLTPRFRDFLRYFEVVRLGGETRRGA